MLDSRVGDLSLDTGGFIFDNFNDVDQSEAISGGIKIGLDGNGVSSFGTEAFSYAYTDLQAITRATVGAGEIIVRNTADGAGFDFRDLNRDVSAVQRLVRDESFAINLPAIELSALVENIEQATAFGEGLQREAAFLKRAHLLDEREIAAIRQGYAGEELRRLVQSESFKRYLRLRKRFREVLNRVEAEIGPLGDAQRQQIFNLMAGSSSFDGNLSEAADAAWKIIREADEEYDIVTRTIGALQVAGGAGEIFAGALGAGACSVGTGGAGSIVCAAAGTVLVVHGVDNVQTGWNAFIYGEDGELLSSQTIRLIGQQYDVSPAAIDTLVTVNEIGFLQVLAAGAIARSARMGLGLSGANGAKGEWTSHKILLLLPMMV